MVFKIAVVGSGGRESALGWHFEKYGHGVLYVPGNGGTGGKSNERNINLKPNDFGEILSLAEQRVCDIVIFGSEDPLAEGAKDYFEKYGRGNLVFGPGRYATQLESSKIFSKEFMADNGIPTANGIAAFDYETAREQAYFMLNTKRKPVVVKLDGLAAGKGVIICNTEKEIDSALQRIFKDNEFKTQNRAVLLEEFLDGEEASCMSITDGQTMISLPYSQDHKRLGEGDTGPNTGGMGAYSPVPFIHGHPKFHEMVQQSVLDPFLKGIGARKIDFNGTLYSALMFSPDKTKVRTLEFNVRFGDPETQVVVPRLRTDLAEIIYSCLNGKLGEVKLEVDQRAAVCVVAASEGYGYPAGPRKGQEITGLDENLQVVGFEGRDDVFVFPAGVKKENGKFYVSGGRVLGITALGDSTQEARDKALQFLDNIHYDGKIYRKDIGSRAIIQNG